MRIAYLSHFHPPTHNAGIEQNTHNLAKAMQAAGHTVAAVCMQHWNMGDTYWQGYVDDHWEEVPVRRFKVNWRLAPDPNRYLFDNPVIAEKVRDFLLEFKPDVVHITSMYTLSTSVIQVADELNLPIVFTLSDFWLACPRHTLVRHDGEQCDGRVSAATCRACLLSETRAYRSAQSLLPNDIVDSVFSALSKQGNITKHLPGMVGWGIDIDKRRQLISERIQKIDRVISPSKYILDAMRAIGLPLQAELSHYGNNLDWLSNYEPRAEDGELHFGYVGQITPIKGVHLLIKAFLENKFSNHVKLFIYGKLDAQPEYSAELNELIGNNTNIKLMDGFLRPELPQVLSNIDILVVPSVWAEVAGLVVQEAFAAGIPVLASNMGGLPEFVRAGEGGLLFNVDDHLDLQNIMATIEDGGPKLLQEMQAAVPSVRTVEDERSYVEQLYEQLVSSREAT